MPKKRRLTDLFKVGKTILINDDSGEDPIEIYIRKLNPVEYETALRRSNIKRSHIIREGKDRESDLYADTESDILDKGREELIDLLMAEEMGNIRASVEAEFAEHEEWSKNEYLQGLRDAWENPEDDAESMSTRFSKDPEDVEAKATFDELKRFYDTVNEETEARAVVSREVWQAKDDEDLVEQAVVMAIDLKSNAEWLREFRACQIWIACKDPSDKKTLYFDSRSEVDELETEIFQRLVQEYMQLEVESTEGKSSEETPDSSNS